MEFSATIRVVNFKDKVSEIYHNILNTLFILRQFNLTNAEATFVLSRSIIIIIIIILSFDIAPFPYKHAQRHITFHCQRIDVDIQYSQMGTLMPGFQ